MTSTGQSKYLHILAGIVSLDILYLEGKMSLLIGYMLFILWETLPKFRKSSAV